MYQYAPYFLSEQHFLPSMILAVQTNSILERRTS